MTGLDFSAAALEQARALSAEVGADVDFVESDLSTPPTCCRSSVRPGLHRDRRAVLAARRQPLGRGASRACSRRAAVCSSARVIRCCGRWPTRCPRVVCSSSIPTSSAAEPLVWDERRNLRRDRRRLHPHGDPGVEPRHRRGRHRAAGPGAGARHSWSSTTACPGRPSPVTWSARRRRVAPARPALAAPAHLHAGRRTPGLIWTVSVHLPGYPGTFALFSQDVG